jgi:hypothetical protein
MTDLSYGGDRNDAIHYLDRHGRNVAATRAADLFAAHGLSVGAHNDDEAPAIGGLRYVTATRN